ncbi:MAG: hypothetical protein A2252_08680 [Elusimicrobia bacterium RIFOXYA2_FULL_39_19]|nr:MAG: hypothetical protein A2252_08680 [Elusimicrobia bacterium RIFOXYA2_FULL_39_19]
MLKRATKLAIMVFLLSICLVYRLESKNLTLLDVGNGEMASNVSDNTKLTLSDDHEGEIGTALKVTMAWKAADKPWGWIGMDIKRSWRDFSLFKLDAFNPNEEPISLTLQIRDCPSSEGKPFNESFILKPGKNEIEIELSGAKAQDGREIDFSKVSSWIITGVGEMFKEPKIFYISNIRLEDGGEPRKIEKKQVVKKKTKEKQKVNKTTTKLKKTTVKTVPVMNIEKGEMPDNVSDNTKVSLSSDYEDEIGMALKVSMSWKAPDKPWGWIGLSIRNTWEEYSSFNFDAYNPGEELISLTLQIRDCPSSEGRPFNEKFILKPGKNEIKVVLIGAKAEDGREMAFSRASSWIITGAGEMFKEPKIFFISNVCLK